MGRLMVKYTRLLKRFESSRLFWVYTILGCFLFFTTAILSLRFFMLSSAITQTTGTTLLKVAQEQKLRILEFIDEQRNNLAALTGNSEIIFLSEQILKTYFLGAKGDFKNTSPEYKEFEKKLDQLLNQQNSLYQFKDMMLIDTQGKIFYTFKNKFQLWME